VQPGGDAALEADDVEELDDQPQHPGAEALELERADDRIRSAATTIYQALIEAELTVVIGAAPREHTDAHRRATAPARGRCRPRPGSGAAHPEAAGRVVFPSLLERRRIDQALFAVVMRAYLHGSPRARSTTWSRPSARTPASLTPKSPGSAPTWTPKVSAFRDRSLGETAFPSVFLHATYCRARVNRR
jgi:putative transposase